MTLAVDGPDAESSERDRPAPFRWFRWISIIVIVSLLSAVPYDDGERRSSVPDEPIVRRPYLPFASR
jgi:hypothetical protein